MCYIRQRGAQCQLKRMAEREAALESQRRRLSSGSLPVSGRLLGVPDAVSFGLKAGCWSGLRAPLRGPE